MKTWTKTISIIFISLLMIACGGKDKREKVRASGRDARGDGTSSTSTRTSYGKGVISTNQELIDTFVSVSGNPSDIIGYIDGTGAGVSFNGSANVENSNSSYRDIESASITIIITDDLAVSKKQDPMKISGFELVASDSYIETVGNKDNVKIEFYDRDYDQRIVLEGTAPHDKNGDFSGKIYFENDDEGIPTDGFVSMGSFSIPLCSFFKCN